VPAETVTAPVVPPLPTSVALVVPSICKLNLPGSVLGVRTLLTVIVPVFGTVRPEIGTLPQEHFDLVSAVVSSSLEQVPPVWLAQVVQVPTSACPLASESWHLMLTVWVVRNVVGLLLLMSPQVLAKLGELDVYSAL